MLDLSRREKVLVGIVLALVISNIGTVCYFILSKEPVIAFKLQDEALPVMSDSVQTKKEIMVYITGAVKNPGVYSLLEGQRLMDAIEKAGGFLSDADLLSVNLAKRLNDEDAYYIPRINEVDETGQNVHSSKGNFAGTLLFDDGKININTADVKELETLPGIGPQTAKKIIDYRNENGPFMSIEEIKNVSGIGEAKFENMKEKIKVK
jgi:competence protein ComEA